MHMSQKFHGSSRFTSLDRSAAPKRAGVMTVAAALLLAAGTARATTVGPLTELTAAPAGEEMRNPAVSYDSFEDKYVIVWEDYRNESTNQADLFVARLTPNLAADPAGGTFIIDDPDGIQLNLGPQDALAVQRSPAIVYGVNGDENVIVWIDSRSGDQDIRATSFLTGLGIFQGDIEVSNSPEPEARPFVAHLNGSYLVAYERGGATPVIEGRRYGILLNPLDVDPVALTNPGSRAPSIAGVGSDFHLTWFDNAGDVFIRSIPPINEIPAITSVQVGTSTESQAAPSVAPLGTSSLYATWDQNTFAGRDIYGDRLSIASLASQGPLGPVSDNPERQIDPKAAGTTILGQSMIVWQDSRDNGKSNIYGARIDNSGAVIEDRGFLVMSRNRDLSEHTITKGANDDYMVVAVENRLDAANPERVFFRLVRDEDPDGIMTTTDTTEIPADGETPAAICFGPAIGASGLPVVDRTSYTLIWSSTAINPGEIEILPEDGDPNLADHQIEAADGEVCFEMRTTRRGVVDVTVTSDEGNATGTVTIDFINVPPVASNAVLLGETSMNTEPRSRDNLVLTYDYFDVNDDPEIVRQQGVPNGTQIVWRVGGEVRTRRQDETFIPAGDIKRGEQWRATINPGDGDDVGSPLLSNEVIIRNTPPSAIGLRICEEAEGFCDDNENYSVRTGDTIVSSWVPDDIDGDAPDEDLTVQRWFLDGQEQPDLQDLEQVDGTLVRKNQQWRFSVLVHDGFEFAEAEVFSSTTTVENTAPVIANPLPDSPAEFAERSAVTLDATSATDRDDDPLTYTWTQRPGNRFQVDFQEPEPGIITFTAPSVAQTAFLEFDVVVSDGEVDVPSFIVVRVASLPDSDGDTIDDELEEDIGTNPNSNDTDGDGIQDQEEVDPTSGEFIIDPLDADSDDDGVEDGQEGRTLIGQAQGGDPFGDPDEDGLVNAKDPDSDNDRILDGTEARRTQIVPSGSRDGFSFEGTDTAAGNFVPDEDSTTETSPILADTDGDGVSDGDEDSNQNGRIDDGESDPNDETWPCSSDAICGSGEVCSPTTQRCEEDTGDRECDVTLDSQDLECCQGDTRVEPICLAGTTQESCPTGAQLRAKGFCSGGGGGGGDSGGCVAVGTEDGAPLGLLFLVLGALFVSRRRRR